MSLMQIEGVVPFFSAVTIRLDSPLISAILAIIAGGVILFRPKLLSYIVAGYLIAHGVITIIPYLT